MRKREKELLDNGHKKGSSNEKKRFRFNPQQHARTSSPTTATSLWLSFPTSSQFVARIHPLHSPASFILLYWTKNILHSLFIASQKHHKNIKPSIHPSIHPSIRHQNQNPAALFRCATSQHNFLVLPIISHISYCTATSPHKLNQ